ncbi:MAG: cation:proton antiporter [Bacteroidetes bacterium]|nr:MAG: cation:proton antiporter [Bacteroidota bacterium]
MLEFMLYIQIFLCVFPLYRIIAGPTIADRIVGIEKLGILVTAIGVIIILLTGQSWMIDIVIAWTILSFISTLTLAKYLENKKLND